jgi:dTDP-4-amino-4,6-dideoxygalactose transaminase
VSERLLMSPPDVGALEEEYVLRAIRSGWVAPTGPEVTAFEEAIAVRCGVAEAVAMSSGTAALHLALLGVGVGPGDVVIVPTMTFVASANAVVYTGAEPCFVDSLLEDGNLDPALVEQAIKQVRADGRRVGAVMAVDLLGKLADYGELQAVCDRHDVPLVEDAAEALGATSELGPAGAFGRVAALSFNGNKIMTTSGGGMLLTDDRALAAHARFLSTQAREPVAHYEHRHIGYNYRMSNVLAALGRAQLERLDGMIARRREIRAAYAEVVADWPGVRIFGSERGDRTNFWLTALVVDPGESGTAASSLMAHLESANIECRPLWKPMHLQPVFDGALSVVNGVAEHLFELGVTLPSGSVHDDAAIDRVCEALREVKRGAFR